MIALTIFLETSALLAMAPFSMEPLIFDLRLKSLWVPLCYGIHSRLPFLIIVFVLAVIAVAVRRAPKPRGEAIAVKLQTLRFLAVTACFLRLSALIV